MDALTCSYERLVEGAIKLAQVSLSEGRSADSLVAIPGFGQLRIAPL